MGREIYPYDFVMPDTLPDRLDGRPLDVVRDGAVAPLARTMSARAEGLVRSGASEAPTEDPVAVLKAKLEAAEYSPEYPREVLVARKARLMELADHMPAIAERLLVKLRTLALEAGVDLGTVALHIVGGRLRGDPPKPLSDNSDFDLVITADNPLLTRADRGLENIEALVRIRIIKALYAEIELIFADRGLEFER